jgi:hypothetical protein
MSDTPASLAFPRAGHSITSSAWASSKCGTSRRSALAISRLIEHIFDRRHRKISPAPGFFALPANLRKTLALRHWRKGMARASTRRLRRLPSVHRRAGIPEASSGGAHNNLTRSTKKKPYV